MRTLLIDNYDSYTYNLAQLIAVTQGCLPVVLANDAPALGTLDLTGFDNIVISPGPGRPQAPRDLGGVRDILADATLPILGVCLGHQAIAHQAGGVVGLAPRPRHGHRSIVSHDGAGLFAGIPQDFRAVRYHSLHVELPLPEALEATAWAEDGVIMGIRHRHLPRWGVQFHPESIASEHGRRLVENFFDLTVSSRSAIELATAVSAPADQRVDQGELSAVSAPASALELVVTTVPGAIDTEAAFGELFGCATHAFWLDNSSAQTGSAAFSFMGDATGPLSEVLTYRIADEAVLVRAGARVSAEGGSIFEALDRRLRARSIPDPGLPFDFAGGYVGYFGYELKADCGAALRHQAETPDAAWIFADRLIAVDHGQDTTYVLALHEGDDERARAEARRWVAETSMQLLAFPAKRPSPDSRTGRHTEPSERVGGISPHLVRDPVAYVEDIEECRRQLVRGESYEICLTNKARVPFNDDNLAFYSRLRRSNPASYAALLRLGEVTVFSSSPERFLRVDGERMVESKPIKGTAGRSCDPARDAELAAELAASPKTQAENLMIVDLLRNDLGKICEIGSVCVPRYMAVESYSTVHQLVSTVRGRLRADVSAIECVRACFPGGSMTGAPKLRTMEIIDRLETEARGIYSGALGYLALTGSVDLSIVIRTSVRFRDELSTGAGGAIVLDSEPSEELDEMLLKADASMQAMQAMGTVEPSTQLPALDSSW